MNKIELVKTEIYDDKNYVVIYKFKGRIYHKIVKKNKLNILLNKLQGDI